MVKVSMQHLVMLSLPGRNMSGVHCNHAGIATHCRTMHEHLHPMRIEPLTCCMCVSSYRLEVAATRSVLKHHAMHTLQHAVVLQMMQQAMKAAMKNMPQQGQPGQANPFGAGFPGMPPGMPGMPPGMPPNMGQGWPPAVDTTAQPSGECDTFTEGHLQIAASPSSWVRVGLLLLTA